MKNEMLLQRIEIRDTACKLIVSQKRINCKSIENLNHEKCCESWKIMVAFLLDPNDFFPNFTESSKRIPTNSNYLKLLVLNYHLLGYSTIFRFHHTQLLRIKSAYNEFWAFSSRIHKKQFYWTLFLSNCFHNRTCYTSWDSFLCSF